VPKRVLPERLSHATQLHKAKKVSIALISEPWF
jgi:hypothetical protein